MNSWIYSKAIIDVDEERHKFLTIGVDDIVKRSSINLERLMNTLS